jgi:hypothetical protein
MRLPPARPVRPVLGFVVAPGVESIGLTGALLDQLSKACEPLFPQFG